MYPFVGISAICQERNREVCVFDIVLNHQPVSQSQSLQLLSADPVNTFLVSPLKRVKNNFSKSKWFTVKKSAGEKYTYILIDLVDTHEWDLALLQQSRRSFRKDTVNIHTPDGTCVSIISAEPFSIHRVPHIRNLWWQYTRETQ